MVRRSRRLLPEGNASPARADFPPPPQVDNPPAGLLLIPACTASVSSRSRRLRPASASSRPLCHCPSTQLAQPHLMGMLAARSRSPWAKNSPSTRSDHLGARCVWGGRGGGVTQQWKVLGTFAVCQSRAKQRRRQKQRGHGGFCVAAGRRPAPPPRPTFPRSQWARPGRKPLACLRARL